MLDLTNQVVKHVFPEEGRRFLRFVQEQKRNLRYWLAIFVSVGAAIAVINIQSVAPYFVLHFQPVYNTVICLWLLVIVTLPFWWPQKRGDFFHEDFRKGLDPRVWEYYGGWKVELDESGASVLTVTDSNMGGLALPCLSWTDYEVRFEVRIVDKSCGWIVRASSLNDYVLQKLDSDTINTHYRVVGYLPRVGTISHGQKIDVGKWYQVRLLARGSWLSTYVTIDGKEELIFQDQALGVKPAAEIQTRYDESDQRPMISTQRVTPSYRFGSFGFRVLGDEKAQYRRVKAYRLGR